MKVYILGLWEKNDEDDLDKALYVANFMGALGYGFTEPKVCCGWLSRGRTERGWTFYPRTPIEGEKGPDLWVEVESAQCFDDAIVILTNALEGTRLIVMDPTCPFICEIG